MRKQASLVGVSKLKDVLLPLTLLLLFAPELLMAV